MNTWTKQKPTKPGMYVLRNKDNAETIVKVLRKGRGMVVHAPVCYDTIRMSDVRDDEFEWMEMETQ